LSYSHHQPDYNNCDPPVSETHNRLSFISPKSGRRRPVGLDRVPLEPRKATRRLPMKGL